MGLNIESAIKYMFKDKDCKKKLLIGSLFMIGMAVLNVMSKVAELIGDMKEEQLKAYMHLLPQFLIIGSVIFIGASILNIFSSGYFAKNINLRIFKPDAELLEWTDWGNMFLVGIKSTIAVCIYIAVFLLILMIPVFFIVLSAAVFNKGAVILCIIVFILLCLILSVFAAIFFSAASLAFCTNLKFASYFNFPLITKFVTKNFLEFFIYVLLIFALSTMANIVNGILALTIVGIVAIPFVLFYQLLVANDLAAQFVRNTLDMNESAQQQQNS